MSIIDPSDRLPQTLTDDEKDYQRYAASTKKPISFNAWLQKMHYDGNYDPENPDIVAPEYSTLDA